MEVLLGTPPPPPPPDRAAVREHGRRQRRQDADDARAHGDAPGEPDVQLVPPVHGSDRPRARQLRRHRQVACSARTACRSTRAATSTTARRSRRRRSSSAVLLKRPMPLVRTFTENLMAYALGRRVEYFDQPTIRTITRTAQTNDYKMSSFILGVVTSDAFRMKRADVDVTEQTSPTRRRNRPNLKRAAAGNDLVRETETCSSSLESTCPAGRSSAAWARRWRCRSSMPWSRPQRATPRQQCRSDAVHLHRGSARHGRLHDVRREQVPLRARDDRPRLHARARQPAERARSVPRVHDDRQQHRRARWPKRSRRPRSAATTSARARCS